MNERHRRTNKETFDQAIWLESRAIRTEIVDPNSNLEIAREYLANGGSLLLETTHGSLFDGVHLMHTINDRLTHPSNLTGIVAMKHFGPKRGIAGSAEKFLADEMKSLFGTGYILVVQEGDDNYENADEINMAATHQAIKVLKKPGQILVIAPQGRRSKNGQLQRGIEGMATIFRLAGENVLTLPVALDTNFPLEIPPFTRTKVIIGEPYSYATIKQEIDAEIQGRLSGSALREAVTQKMMLRLAELVKPEKRGFYAAFS